MQIEVIAVNVVNKGKYRDAEVTFKNAETGKVDAKTVRSFVFKDVFKTLSEAKQGDVFEIKSEQNAKGYWDWTEAVSAGKNFATPEKKQAFAQAVKGRDFESSEERAKRQVYIVRQSSISAALDLLKHNVNGRVVTAEEVIALARTFEGYVFESEPVEVEVT